ncbi:MAG: ABC transporter ATP-binding protein [Pseudomonadota bacterium]
MPSDDIAISVRNLTKCYRLFGHPGDRIKQFLSLGLKRYHRDFTALADVSFEIKRGETVGIIGRNGSGKSTLLQLICGILKPTSGHVQVNGRVAALLELGAGFNPEFTGRENVYFQGALMGFDKAQMDGRFEAIAAFADIGEFIDQPVRTYSSGMFVRLAFAAAVNAAPDILVVDEALAVGDVGFQRKCYARLGQIQADGGTIVIVSHSTAALLELCNQVVFLDKGEMRGIGPAKRVLDQYIQKISIGSPQIICHSSPKSLSYAETHGATILDPHIVDTNEQRVWALERGREYYYCYQAHFLQPAQRVRFAMMLKTKSGYELGGMVSHLSGQGIDHVNKDALLEVRFPFRCHLLPGAYFLNSGILGQLEGQERFLFRVIDIAAFEVLLETEMTVGGHIDFGISNKQPIVRNLGGH